MKQISLYITEKLRINKNTKLNIDDNIDEISNIIKDYCQKTLKITTFDYITTTANAKDSRFISLHFQEDARKKYKLNVEEIKDALYKELDIYLEKEPTCSKGLSGNDYANINFYLIGYDEKHK